MTTDKPLIDVSADAIAAIQKTRDDAAEARRERAALVKSITQKISDLEVDLRTQLVPILGVESAWQVDLSYDWRCPHSPIGTCIYTPRVYGCRFCGDPQERK